VDGAVAVAVAAGLVFMWVYRNLWTRAS
jgi:hypothetical protein